MKKILLLLIIISNFLFAQETPQSGIGISASYQAAQLSILLPVWLNEKIILEPSIGFSSVEDAGQDYQIGIELKKFLYKEKTSPFIGIRFGTAMYSPKSSHLVSDFIYGIAAGGEYFVDRNFSLGIEGQLNASKSDKKSARFGAPGKLIINTATAIYATIYFN